LIRAYLPNIRLLDTQDKRVEAVKVLNMVDAGIDSIPVWIPFERNTPLAARLVVKKLPPEQAAKARARAKKRLSKSQKKGSDLAIRLAGYVVLLTTVPESDLSNEQLLKTYQLRWQIELFFKRCKSLPGLDEVRAGGRVAHSWLLGKMLIAALIDRKLVQLLEETNGGTP
jgi:IS4 transposase